MTSAYLDPPDDTIAVAPVRAIVDPPPHNEIATAIEEAVLYLRVSSKKQMDTDSDFDPEGNSIPTQRRHGTAKAESMGVRVSREFVEPGRSATSLEKRVAFQEMMAYLETENKQRKKDGQPLIRYVIVYMMSRAFRNALEELTTKAQLAKMGITLISAKENFGDGYLGDAMQGILAIFNELQVRMSGEDIKTKMANKARNGGTVSRAPIGYLNVTRRIEGREVRTVIIDPERAPLIRLAFVLYATGDFSFEDLAEELYDRGLTTRPTAKHPAGPLSVNKVSDLLRDRYYLGYIDYKGEEIQGRHEPLVDEDLFEQVQEVIETRAAAHERRRVHHHYLKGSLFCGACKAGGFTRRMIMQQTTNRHGTTYLYFFCRGRQHDDCTTPHINVLHLEEAVERHYATIGFTPTFIAEMRRLLNQAVGEQEAAAQLFHQQLTAELEALDTREDNLLNLAADGEMPQAKIKVKLREIDTQRRKLQGRLAETSSNLRDAVRLIDLALTLLEDPQAAYLRSDEHQRRLFNQAIFQALYVEEDKITGHELREPFARLHALQAAREDASRHDYGSTEDEGTGVNEGASSPQNDSRTLPQLGKGPASVDTLEVLLGGTGSVPGSSKASMVEVAGIEPASFGDGSGLLRVQPAWRFLSPGAHAGVSPTGSVAVWCSYRPRDRIGRWSLLTMPDPGSETLPG